MTASTVDVLKVLLDGAEPIWGLQVIKKTGRLPGTVYPILERLERQGWVSSSWEEDAERSGPRRRLYKFTDGGRLAAQKTCVAFERKDSPAIPATRGRWAAS